MYLRVLFTILLLFICTKCVSQNSLSTAAIVRLSEKNSINQCKCNELVIGNHCHAHKLCIIQIFTIKQVYYCMYVCLYLCLSVCLSLFRSLLVTVGRLHKLQKYFKTELLQHYCHDRLVYFASETKI